MFPLTRVTPKVHVVDCETLCLVAGSTMIVNEPLSCLVSRAQCLFILVLCLLLQCHGSFYDNPEQDPLPSGPDADEELHRKWDHEVGRVLYLVGIPSQEVDQYIYCSWGSLAYRLLHISSMSNASAIGKYPSTLGSLERPLILL